MYNIANDIDFSVFPGHQGGPHNHTISALATGLKQAASPEFKMYQKQVMSNSAAFAARFQELGYDLVSGGTDNHLLLINLNPKVVDRSIKIAIDLKAKHGPKLKDFKAALDTQEFPG